MKVCERVNFIQIIDNKGTVRMCSWRKDGGIIGRLCDDSLKDIYHSDKAKKYIEQLASGDYSNCRKDDCFILSSGCMNEHCIDTDDIPEYPEELWLAFEQSCNYRCPSCTVHNCLVREMNNSKDIEKDYEIIEDRLQEALPYVKRLSANGWGELFCSRHILNILANWKPISPKEEISVILETNGSLFNEQNWEKIKNLGQYHLEVDVTVMSFEEPTYQHLSGTKLSVENIKKNLAFMKRLREEGVINYLEIATVYQEANFRSLPRFVEEALTYNPDYIRLRPYVPWGSQSKEEMWFADVRGKYHPYHDEFLAVMKNPILNHPVVHDLGGGCDSESSNYPINMNRLQAEQKSAILSKMITDDSIVEKLKNLIGANPVSIYGLGDVGKALARILDGEIRILSIIDKKKCGLYNNIKVLRPSEAEENVRSSIVVLSVMYDKAELAQELRRYNFVGEILDIRDIVM